MKTEIIHSCQCRTCLQKADHPDKTIHHQINLVMSRLDEQQRRWYAAVEANRHGRGGLDLVSRITGLDEKTIRRGQQELALELSERPTERVRLPGGGRQPVEKKTQPSKQA